MFSVATKEVEKMNPTVALQLLRTFGFKLQRDGLPISFDKWKASLNTSVDAGTSAAILGNRKLMIYLRTVVDVIRRNPAVISKGASGSTPATPPAGLAYFRTPPITRDMSNLGDVLQQTVIMTPQTPLSMLLGNPMARMPWGFGLIGGGASNCVNARLLRDTFSVLYRQMERAGKELVEEDKQRIEKTIARVEKLEDQLAKLMGEMKLFLKLHGALSVDSTTATETISIDDLIDENKITPTGNILTTITNSTNQNLRNLTQLINELVNKVRPAMLQVLSGQPSAVLVPAV